MIYSYLHQGSGTGNQLFRMVAARVKALDLGVDWRMIWNPDNSGKPTGFKCKDFMFFDESKIVYEKPNLKEWNEKKVVENGIDVRGYDPEFNFIEDNTIIEGEFQDEMYFSYRLNEVDEWLRVKLLNISDDVCVIGFRGGEFALYPDLFLTPEYWQEGIKRMLDINPNMKFEVHTDDPALAQAYFPNFKVIHDIGTNWRSMRYAKHAIIANSSFFILPRLLNHHLFSYPWCNDGITIPRMAGRPVTIAPRYWGRRNIEVWSLPQNYYKSFLYI